MLALALGLAASPRAPLAQDPGDRVRVRTDVRMLIGQIVALRENRIDLALDGWELAELEGPYYSVTRTDIRVVERSRGALPRVGITAAALGGAGLGLAWTDICLGPPCASTSRKVLGTVLGAGAGLAVLFLLLGENERWEPVRLLGTTPAFSPIVGLDVHGGSGAVLGLRLRP